MHSDTVGAAWSSESTIRRPFFNVTCWMGICTLWPDSAAGFCPVCAADPEPVAISSSARTNARARRILKCLISCSFQKTKNYNFTLTLVGRLARAVVSCFLLYKRPNPIFAHKDRLSHRSRPRGRLNKAMENSPGANAIEVLSLTRRFGSLVAVDHLTFSCAAGATFGLLGPNGAGKSTLIKMLTTLLPPSEGTAKIAGCDLVEHPEAVRRKIGYVSQMLSADGDLTGYENLLISAKLYCMPRSERCRPN